MTTPEMKPERIPTPFFDGVRIDDLSGKIQPMVTVDDYNLLAERCRRAEATRPTPQPSSEADGLPHGRVVAYQIKDLLKEDINQWVCKVVDVEKALNVPNPAQPSSEYVKAVEAVEHAAIKMAEALVRYPVFHRCGFPNAAEQERCLSCKTDKALQYFNEALATLKSHPTPAKEPSGEYGEAIKDALHDLNKLNNAGWTPTLTSARERASKIHADLTEALAALKSHPTPAKEPSGELVEAAKKMADWMLDGMLDFDYADALQILIDHKKLQNAVAAYHAQVTKEVRG